LKIAINRLFVGYKPASMSSNRYLSKIKRTYQPKKAGFSGTLDPFAKGVLIIAFGQYTKLFRFLKKSPKSYRATLWLGAHSDTLDIEKVDLIKEIPHIPHEKIIQTLNSLKGKIDYLPPKYSAKKINGERAYKLARNDEEINLKKITSTISKIELIHYNHPFLTFEITISEGGYIRSMGDIIANKLGTFGSLSALERLHEGELFYNKEEALDPIKYLNVKQNYYLSDHDDILLGKKVSIENFQIKEEGEYFLKIGTILSIIKIEDSKVTYILNGVKLC
jgi:tRNA pseudouridine55 synthase